MHVLFTSALEGVEWSASRVGRFIPRTNWIGDWVDPRGDMDAVEKRKFLTLPELELRNSLVQAVASRYTDCAIPARS
jgi:hypothetical protein